MFEQIKNNLFTIHGIATSVLHVMLLVGVLASYVYFQVEILQNDVRLSAPIPHSKK